VVSRLVLANKATYLTTELYGAHRQHAVRLGKVCFCRVVVKLTGFDEVRPPKLDPDLSNGDARNG